MMEILEFRIDNIICQIWNVSSDFYRILLPYKRLPLLLPSRITTGIFLSSTCAAGIHPSSNARAAKVATKSIPTRERIMTTEPITMTGIRTAIEGNK